MIGNNDPIVKSFDEDDETVCEVWQNYTKEKLIGKGQFMLHSRRETERSTRLKSLLLMKTVLLVQH